MTDIPQQEDDNNIVERFLTELINYSPQTDTRKPKWPMVLLAEEIEEPYRQKAA